MSLSSIEVRREGTVTRLVMARAQKGNSLSAAMVEEMSAAVAHAYTDGTRALLIEGSGAHFCTGFDLSDLEQETDDTLLARFVRVELLLQQIHRAPFVTSALAHGKTWGAGADLFAACTVRSADADTTFAFPGAGFGLVLGTGRLGALVTASRANDWILSGRQIMAEEAARAGLVQHMLENADSTGSLAQLQALTTRLDAPTLAQIRAAAEPRSKADDAMDLAYLVSSAARPGLKARIAAYRATQISRK